ncbi:MAG: hypothetical protein IIA85_00315 [Nanoarchaeota archaeon]|nr:hypothetical protein [Nanoarchaeota archaeon]
MKKWKDRDWKKCGNMKCGSSGCVYFLGFLGATVFYIQQATGFWMGVLGVLKAFVWPAFVVFKLLGM